MSKNNPYRDVKDTTAFKWMIKNSGKRMLFSFLFLLIFMVAPWVGPWRFDALWARLLVTGIATLLNGAATILHPYLIYRDYKKSYDRWEYNHEKYKDKPGYWD